MSISVCKFKIFSNSSLKAHNFDAPTKLNIIGMTHAHILDMDVTHDVWHVFIAPPSDKVMIKICVFISFLVLTWTCANIRNICGKVDRKRFMILRHFDIIIFFWPNQKLWKAYFYIEIDHVSNYPKMRNQTVIEQRSKNQYYKTFCLWKYLGNEHGQANAPGYGINSPVELDE